MMSSETAISVIETVKKKLERYLESKQSDKVKEYLHKLHNTSVNSSLLRETQIDVLVKRLASDSKSSYSGPAKTLLKKWNDKNLLPKNNETSKVKTITNTNGTGAAEKRALKRKSDDDAGSRTHSKSFNESQSADRGHDSSAPTKKRKVLSLSEYKSNKQPASSTATNSTEEELTETQIQEIYARFNANIEGLAVNAPDLANHVNKKLTQKGSVSNNRLGLALTDPRLHLTTEPSKSKAKGIWDEDEDDDEDHPQTSPIPKQSEPEKSKAVKTTSTALVQQIPTLAPPPVVKKPSKTIAPINHPPPPPVAQPATVDAYAFLRPKKERQAIYSGKRVMRTSISSLQDLCIENLKENLEDVSHKHFHLLPYELVKPVITAATPEQLYHIIDNNPDYADEVEHIWKGFCTAHYKGVEREECETYYELYWRKHNEKEERLQQITELAKQKKAQTIDHTRQTKKLAYPQTRAGRSGGSKDLIPSIHRTAVGLPPSKMSMSSAKGKKPTITPLLKKTLKLCSGKG